MIVLIIDEKKNNYDMLAKVIINIATGFELFDKNGVFINSDNDYYPAVVQSVKYTVIPSSIKIITTCKLTKSYIMQQRDKLIYKYNIQFPNIKDSCDYICKLTHSKGPSIVMNTIGLHDIETNYTEIPSTILISSQKSINLPLGIMNMSEGFTKNIIRGYNRLVNEKEILYSKNKRFIDLPLKSYMCRYDSYKDYVLRGTSKQDIILAHEEDWENINKKMFNINTVDNITNMFIVLTTAFEVIMADKPFDNKCAYCTDPLYDWIYVIESEYNHVCVCAYCMGFLEHGYPEIFEDFNILKTVHPRSLSSVIYQIDGEMQYILRELIFGTESGKYIMANNYAKAMSLIDKEYENERKIFICKMI